MSFFGGIWDTLTDVGHAVSGMPTAEQKRNTQRMMNEQMKAYRDQTELTRQEIARKREAENTEKRRIEEKQIRSLRRNYRPQGLLGQGNAAPTDVSNKLGG